MNYNIKSTLYYTFTLS